jgi:hypothetical protein
MSSRFSKVDLLNLKAVEREIDTLISIAGDNPSEATIKEVTRLVKVAKALGTSRTW